MRKFSDWVIASVLIGLSAYGGYQLQYITRPPAIELLHAEFLEKEAAPGDVVTLHTKYFKNRDCVGSWEFRGKSPSGKIFVINMIDYKTQQEKEGQGKLGTNPPNTFYEYKTKIVIPENMEEGVLTVTELDTCYDSGETMRS